MRFSLPSLPHFLPPFIPFFPSFPKLMAQYDCENKINEPIPLIPVSQFYHELPIGFLILSLNICC